MKMHPSMPLDEARAICRPARASRTIDAWGAGQAHVRGLRRDLRGERSSTRPSSTTTRARSRRSRAPHRDDPDLVERFEAGRRRRASSPTPTRELNDPVDQRARFEAEAAAKAGRRRGGRGRRRRLHPRARVRAAADRRARDRARPPRDADRRRRSDPRRDPVPDDAPGDGARGARRPRRAGLRQRAHRGRARRARRPTAPRPRTAPQPRSVAAAATARRLRSRPPGSAGPAPLRPLRSWLPRSARLSTSLPVPAARPARGFDSRHSLLPRRRPASAAHVGLGRSAGVCLGLVAPRARRGKHRAWQVAVRAVRRSALVVHVLKGPHPLADALRAGMAGRADLRSATPSARRPTRARCSARSCFVPAYLGAGARLRDDLAGRRARPHRAPASRVGGILETVFGGLVGLDGPYTYERAAVRRVLRRRAARRSASLGAADPALCSSSARVSLAASRRPDARAARAARARARLRRRHARLLRAARRQELLLRLRRARDDRLHATCAATRWSPPTRSAPPEVDGRGARRVPRASAASAAGTSRSSRCARTTPTLYRGARHAPASTSATRRSSAATRSRLDGPGMKPVRSAVRRVGRDAPLRAPARVRRLAASCATSSTRSATRWRGKAPGARLHDGARRGRCAGDRARLPARRRARGRGERPVGFLRLVPCYGADPGYSLDLMQPRPDAANGMTEFLIANAALALGERGFRRLSMNFAAWGRLFDTGADLTPAQRAQKWVAEALNPFFQVKSLRDFNEKFQPEWLPRSIVIEDPAAMPKVGAALRERRGLPRPSGGRRATSSRRCARTATRGNRPARPRGRPRRSDRPGRPPERAIMGRHAHRARARPPRRRADRRLR